MKISLFSLLVLGWLTACQPGNKADTANANALSQQRIQYRLILLKRESRRGEQYLRDFEAKVKQSIAEGWEPLGGVSFAMGFPVQTMIKR